VYVNEALVDTVLTKYADYTIENAPTLRGPCILEVKASDLTVAEFSVQLRQASLGALSGTVDCSDAVIDSPPVHRCGRAFQYKEVLL
jgi:hypothetical protein